MKFLGAFLIAAALALASPAFAQSPATVKLCIQVSPSVCTPVSATAPLPITGSFSATLAGFTPNGNYTTLTATAASSASTTLPAGTVVSFQNLSTIDVSCVLTAGASTATTNKLIVRGGATVYYTVGANTTTACINQTGVASNVVSLAGGDGLGTAFGGGGGGGGGGGAVTMVSGAVASGAYSAGSIAAGAFVSGSILSGALASGAVVDITNLSTPVAAGAATATKGILLGGQFDTTQKTLTNGQQAAVSLSPRGAIYVAAGAEALVVGGAGTAGSASGGVLTVQGSASGTPIPVSGTVTITPAGTQAVSIASGQVASGAIASGAVASGAFASGALASGSMAAGAMVDLLTMRGTVAAGTAAANSLLTGCIYNSSPITLTTGQGSALQCSVNGYPTVVVSNTLTAITPGDGITTGTYASASPVIGATLLWNGTTYDRMKSAGVTGVAAVGGAGTAGSASGGVLTVQGVASMTPIATNITQVLGAAVSATNGLFTNVLQGNAVLSASNPLPVTPAAATPATPIAVAASDNHAVLKNGAGTAMSVHTSNNSATKNYLRLYDAGTGFNGCNSATGVIFAMEIPPNDSGFSVSLGGGVGIAFTNGLSWCITSGFGLTDTTNATASAIYANASYR
jgi:hypothetical protein